MRPKLSKQGKYLRGVNSAALRCSAASLHPQGLGDGDDIHSIMVIPECDVFLLLL